MPLQLELHLDERAEDRVIVTVRIRPSLSGFDGDASVDGLSVQLLGPAGEPRSCRMLLPFAGRMVGPAAMRCELRALEGIPEGSRVVAQAWQASDQWEASCPADPSPGLEDHMRGRCCVSQGTRRRAAALTDAEREALVQRFPWLCRPMPEPGPLAPLAPLDAAPDNTPAPEDLRADVDDFCQKYGLCEEDAEFLEALLGE